MTQEPLVLFLTEVGGSQVVILVYAFARLVWIIHAHVHRELPVRHRRLAHDTLATRARHQRVCASTNNSQPILKDSVRGNNVQATGSPAAVRRFAHRRTRKSDV